MAYINIILQNEEENKKINLNVNKSEIIIIKGPFGSGKTTLLDCISLSQKNNDIIINIDDKNINKLNIKQKINFKRNYISHSSLQFIDNLTVLENIYLMCKVKKNYLDINSVLTNFKIEDKTELYPTDLSKHDLGLLSVAMSVIKNTDIMLIDDAIDNLNKKEKNYVIDYIKDLCKKEKKIAILTCEDESDIKAGIKIIDIVTGKVISTKKKEIKEEKNTKSKKK